jgi:hypothetical protein
MSNAGKARIAQHILLTIKSEKNKKTKHSERKSARIAG